MGEAFPGAVGKGGNEGFPGGGALWDFSCAVGTAGNLGLPGRGPISWEEMGERTPGGGGSSPGTPFSGGVVWGRLYFFLGYLACGPHSERPVTARPPAGRAGDVGGYPLGEGREEPFGFPLSPPVNKPLLPPARAGGRAMRRWSCEAAGQVYRQKTPPPAPTHQRKGVRGKEPPPPVVFFPLFLQRNRAPPGRAPFPPVPTAKERNRKPPVRASPAQTAPPPAPRTAGRRDG